MSPFDGFAASVVLVALETLWRLAEVGPDDPELRVEKSSRTLLLACFLYPVSDLNLTSVLENERDGDVRSGAVPQPAPSADDTDSDSRGASVIQVSAERVPYLIVIFS